MRAPKKRSPKLAKAQQPTASSAPEDNSRSSNEIRALFLDPRQFVILPGEQEAFNQVCDLLEKEIAPSGALEWSLFQQLVRAAWDTRRIRRLEAKLAQKGAQLAYDPNLVRQAQLYARHLAQAERSYRRASRALRDVRKSARDRDRALLKMPVHSKRPN